MPIAKYKRDKKSGLYYSYQKTGLYRPNGKPEYKKVTAKTIARLDEKIDRLKELSACGVTETNLTVNQWYERWLKAYKSNCRPNTVEWYKNHYKCHIAPNIGSMRLRDVREHHLQSILSGLSETHSKNTIKGIRAVIGSLFETAQHNRLILQNPALKLKVGGKTVEHRRELTKEERKSYLATCLKHDFGMYAAFLYFFGLRRGEALALTGKDISDDSIRICKQCVFPTNNEPVLQPMPKTDAGFRSIPIPDAARKYIDFDNLPDGLLFSDPFGKPMTYTQVVKRWNSFLKDALGEDTPITIHYLRHNYCTMLAECGVDMLSAKTYVGHSNIKMTMEIYMHQSEKLKTQADDKIRLIG